MNPFCKKYDHNFRIVHEEWTPWGTLLVRKICKRCRYEIGEQLILPEEEREVEIPRSIILLRKDEDE